jgi:hypothetical protein
MVLVSTLVVGVVVGCEGTPHGDPSTTKGKVHGVVTIAGVPAKEGEIIFDAANKDRKFVDAAVGKIGPDGTYEVETYTGSNAVSLGGSLVKKKPFLERVNKTFVVKSGDNEFNFEAPTDK